MGRYDDDDSEYVAYGNMGSGTNSESKFEKLKKFQKLFINQYANSDVSIDIQSTSEIEKLAEILYKISQKEELSTNDKKFIVKYVAKESLLKADVTYNDIKDLPEFEGLSECIGTRDNRYYPEKNDEQLKELDMSSFSAHNKIIDCFYKNMKWLPTAIVVE